MELLRSMIQFFYYIKLWDSLFWHSRIISIEDSWTCVVTIKKTMLDRVQVFIWWHFMLDLRVTIWDDKIQLQKDIIV